MSSYTALTSNDMKMCHFIQHLQVMSLNHVILCNTYKYHHKIMSFYATFTSNVIKLSFCTTLTHYVLKLHHFTRHLQVTS
jgi:hypothetical protein